MQEDSFYTIFAKLYASRVNLYKKVQKLEQEIKLKLKDQLLLKNCIQQKEEDINKKKVKSNSKDFVFTLSKGPDTYFEVLDIGKLSEISHNKEFIYPLGYKSRRIYISYKDPDKKMTYICEIKNSGLEISAEDFTWSGINLWKDFCDSFDQNIEFKSIEHFFGLTYKPVQYRIEKLGDISIFVNYIMLDERKK